MAIFKKLFSGDVVVTGEGKCFKKLTTLSPQIGTWVFNDEPDWTDLKWEYIANVDFTSNGEEFEQLLVDAMGYKVMYQKKGQTTYLEAYRDGEWQDDAYKTITITGGEDIDSNDIYVLYYLATKQS